MEWKYLINDKRFGLEDYHHSKPGLRSDFQRDYDRLIFSSPFRRCWGHFFWNFRVPFRQLQTEPA